jgi:hypothetical protein
MNSIHVERERERERESKLYNGKGRL